MAEKKKTNTKTTKRNIEKAPTLRERITDTSLGGHSTPIWIPKKKTK